MNRIWCAALALVGSATVAFGRTDPIPQCRLDHTLTPIVQKAFDWSLEGLAKRDLDFQFERIIVNPTGTVPERALAVYLVKDAAESTIDRATKCIRREAIGIGSPKGVVRTDGDCVPTALQKCTAAEKQYMQKRFLEIASFESGDRETGYEMSGACYMTNPQGCLRKDYLDLLRKVGRRDALTVGGGCVANSESPQTIRCSAGALKMMLSREAAAEGVPTVGILFLAAHELAHLGKNESSSFDGDDHVIDLSFGREKKQLLIRNECQRGESRRAIERNADAHALAATKTRLGEINARWPSLGTTSWLVMQAGHFATNVARWSNDWHDGPNVETPEIFRQPVIQSLNASEVDLDREPGSGRAPAEIRAAALAFLCELMERKEGRWDVLIQSGTTHGTLPERLITIMAELRPETIEDDPVSRLESMIAKIGELGTRRHAAYLRELEGEICSMVETALQCP